MEDGFWARAGRALCPVWLRATTPSTVTGAATAGRPTSEPEAGKGVASKAQGT